MNCIYLKYTCSLNSVSFCLATLLYSATVLANPNPDYLSQRNRPRAVRDQYCGAYVVWHTLRYYDLAKPIDIIFESMQVEKDKGVSIAEVISTLRNYGVKARAVKLHLDNIVSIEKPFIPYIPPEENKTSGHFVLCIPIGSGQSLVLDGQETPYLVDMFDLQGENARAGWDGTSILLENNSSKTFELIRSISRKLFYLIVLLTMLGSFVYLFDKFPAGTQTSERRLPMD